MHPWWRDAVVYQVYPRSFADSNGDGVGDLPGITQHLDYLADLGVDAIWIGPCFASPQVDHGYDVADYRAIDPLFGTLSDMDALIEAAHARGIRVTLDFVPNHTSHEHAWFRAAVTAGPGSYERTRYHFRDGRGRRGEQPPNNWRSAFGGSAWSRVTEPDGSPGQWYFHLFAPEQPDLNYANPDVVAELSDVLRFWLQRGIDGFRIDVADGLDKDPGFVSTRGGRARIRKDASSIVHDVYRAFRAVLDEYPGDRMAVIETGADTKTVALFLRPDEMPLAFNLEFLHVGFEAPAFRRAIDATLAAMAPVGAPATWVTDNHDTTRSVTRYGRLGSVTGAYVPGELRVRGAGAVDLAAGQRRARAVALLLLAMPGAVYLYQGQELGLENVDDLPESALQDPIWQRSGRTLRGRDGCRVPMPWSGDRPPFGFSTSPETWLPIPESWASRSVAAQTSDPCSTLALYKAAIRLRRHHAALGRGELRWVRGGLRDVLTADLVADALTVRVIVNFGVAPVALPAGELLLSSAALDDGRLPGEAAAWLRLPD
jgi:alpha-glucosidase